jgi:hypothetical protein
MNRTTVPWLLVLVAGIARAGSIDDAKSIKEGKEEFAKRVQDLNQKCGSKIAASFDEKTTLPAVPEKTYTVGAPWYTCGWVLDGMGMLCADPDAKEVLLKKVKSVKCSMRDGVHEKMRKQCNKASGTAATICNQEYSLKGDTFNAVFDRDPANVDIETRDWLKSNL